MDDRKTYVPETPVSCKENNIVSHETLTNHSSVYAKRKRCPIGQSRLLKDKIASFKQTNSKNIIQNDSEVEVSNNLYSSEVLKRFHSYSETKTENFNRDKLFKLRQYSSLSCVHQKSSYHSFFFRSHSLPSVITSNNYESDCELQTCDRNLLTSTSITHSNSPCVDSFNKTISEENLNNEGLSRCNSTSTVRDRNFSVDSSYSLISGTEIAEDILGTEEKTPFADTSWKPQHSRSKSDFEFIPNDADHTLESKVFSLPNSFSENKEPPRKSIFEGKQMVVPTECFFPRPQQGQSLTSFLSSNEFNISAELDRENAHFCISEALIAAIEHMKCTLTKKSAEEVEDESDEEIQKLTQRIRIRRRERQKEQSMRNLVLLSDGRTDTTSQSASPPLSSHSSDFEADSIKSEDEVEDIEISAHTESNLNSLKESGLSLSMASLYSDADIHKVPFQPKESGSKFQESDPLNLSAESVALSLLKKFSEKHLPKASELQWLVSEQEAPQRLLPLPDSWPISPDCIEEEYNLTNTRLRGNLEWAPPRAQIIFNIHPHLKRKDVIEKQKYRCAGCGMKIERSYINKFRYCNYFGKYFCQCCHNNGLAYIPGRILWKWDFTKYYVSKFAWELLDNMYCDPLFNISDINTNLYQKVRQLKLCRSYRMQLYYLKDFMKTCRKANIIQATMETQSQHILNEPNLYSLNDLVQVKSGELYKQLKVLTNYCLEHVKSCILCQAKGFICEICCKEDIIFPFQLDRVDLCQACGSCFHKCCFKNVKCPRCIRFAERMKRLSQERSNEVYM